MFVHYQNQLFAKSFTFYSNNPLSHFYCCKKVNMSDSTSTYLHLFRYLFKILANYNMIPNFMKAVRPMGTNIKDDRCNN